MPGPHKLGASPFTIDPGALRPHGDCERGEGPAEFVAGGTDPQLIYVPKGPQRRAFRRVAGLKVRLILDVLEGRLVEPRVYADWGEGYGEIESARLRLTDDGYLTALLAPHGRRCRSIRIDPSVDPCVFRVTALEIEPTASIPAGRWTSARDGLIDALGPFEGLARRVNNRVLALANIRQPVGGDAPYFNAWAHSFAVARHLRSALFAAPPVGLAVGVAQAPPIYAFYLPQFHPIPENDRWWGQGFTEWTNVTKATPQFPGHYQPRLPGALGYYDLRIPSTMARQVDLAKSGGISGFCFHYYWFAGKRLLEGPINAYLADSTLDLPFMRCWANVTWTRRWDGQESDVLIAQDHSHLDDLAVFDDIARHMVDPRYVRFDGKPVLIVYRPDILPDAAATSDRWRERAKAMGVGDIHLLATNAFGFSDYKSIGFDGVVQFPPHTISAGEITHRVAPFAGTYAGKVFDYAQVVENEIAGIEQIDDPAVFAGVMPGWDNEARKPGAGHVFHGADPELFRTWLDAALRRSAAGQPDGARAVFVNAWNEWAEGAYLEPDRWFGHGYLQAARSAVETFAPRLEAQAFAFPEKVTPPSRPALLLHVFYLDVAERIAARLIESGAKFDTVVTFPNTWSITAANALSDLFPGATLQPVDNRGRDVAPFIRALKLADERGCDVFCKIHTKKSPHLGDGEQQSEALFKGLLGKRAFEVAVGSFAADPSLGLLATRASRMRLDAPDVMHNNTAEVAAAAARLSLDVSFDNDFAAGTMFWGRTKAFKRLIQVGPALEFPREMGRIDGTLAHAIERLTSQIVVAEGFKARYEL